MFEFSIMLTIKICNLNFIHFLLKKNAAKLSINIFRQDVRTIYLQERSFKWE